MKSFLPSHLQHQSRGQPRRRGRYAGGLTVRGVVIEVYEPDSLNLRNPLIGKGGIVCDVLVYETDAYTVMRQVPIAMQSAGLNDHEVWRPRKASVNLAGGALSVGKGPIPTKAEDMDGDHVLIQFVANDLQQPIIIAQLPHPKNTRKTSTADATKYKYRRYVRGSSFGVKDNGDIEVDLTAASDGSIGPSGAEISNPSAGNLVVIHKLGTTTDITAATLSDPQYVLLADDFLTDLLAAMTQISGVLGGFFGPAAVSDVVELVAKLTTAVATGIPYRSQYLRAD